LRRENRRVKVRNTIKNGLGFIKYKKIKQTLRKNKREIIQKIKQIILKI
jgi:hypothetical protein